MEFPDHFDDTKNTKQQMDLLGSRKFLNSLQPTMKHQVEFTNYERIVSMQEHKASKSSKFMLQKTEHLAKKAPARRNSTHSVRVGERRNILSLKCENSKFFSKKNVTFKQVGAKAQPLGLIKSTSAIVELKIGGYDAVFLCVGPKSSEQGATVHDISKNQYASQVAVSLTNLFGQPDTKKVMVVDDEVFLLEFLREILETLGLEVYTASSPERAFELSTTLSNLNKKIDLVYMDFNMPGMNGAECVRILKSELHKRAMEHAWFTALSAQDDKMVRDQFRSVGVSEFISKPYTFEQIVQHLAQRQLISIDTRKLVPNLLSNKQSFEIDT